MVMMRPLFALIIVVVLSSSSAAGALNANWKLVWNDEFSGSQLDASKWTARTQAGFSSNGEMEYYLPSQVSVANGNLIITSDYKPTNGYPYISGTLDTAGKFDFTYGRYEVSAKLPFGKGLWPAHWLLSDFLCWPVGAEIDIMENLGDQMSTIYGTFHFGSCCGCNSGNGSAYTASGVDLSKGFHTYAVEWFPNSISWYLDNVMYKTVVNTSLNGGKPYAIDNTPHYWILNTAVGGNWPGKPDNTTIFPQYHYIDYVRVYAWNPCVSGGCGTNGCCNTTSQTCKCNPDVLGSNCEFVTETNFSTTYNTLSSLETLSSVNAAVGKGLLTLQATNTSCPQGCGGAPYIGGSWNTVNSYKFGNFTTVLKSTSSSGSAVVFWGESATSAFEGFQVTLAGQSPTQVSMQYWVNGASTWVGTFNLGFDASQNFHTYTIIYQSGSFTLYVDKVKIAQTTSAPAGTGLTMRVELDLDSQWYGPIHYTGPVYAFAKSAQFIKQYQPPVTCK